MRNEAEFHVFHTTGIPDSVVADHRAVAERVGVNVRYHSRPHSEDTDVIYTAHGAFMTQMLQEARSEAVCFLDVDCLPYDVEPLDHAYTWAVEHASFVGNAQNISHSHLRQRTYAAASMLIVSRAAWDRLGRPALTWTMRRRFPPTGWRDVVRRREQVDTAQPLSLAADRAGYPYRVLYPRGFDAGPVWSLGSYGDYGRGTWYPGTWHFFRLSALKEGRSPLWDRRVAEFRAGQVGVPEHASLGWLEGLTPAVSETEL